MRLLAVLPALIVAGCATPIPLEQKIANASTIELCEAVYYAPPNVAVPARAEAERRGENCGNYVQAVSEMRAQREATRARQAAAALQYMQMTRPQPMQMPQIPQTTTCRSRVVGNQVYTDCN